MSASCRGCDRKWASLTEAHCSVCHAQFTGATYFDQHRVNGECWGTCTLVAGKIKHGALVYQEGLWGTLEGFEARRTAVDRLQRGRGMRRSE